MHWVHTKKYLACFFICFFSFPFCFSQSSKNNLLPFKTDTLSYSKEKEEQFYDNIKNCDSILNAVNTEEKFQSLNKEELKLLSSCDQEVFEYYDVSSKQCNWYCAGGPDTILASNKKKESKKQSFEVSNLHDFMHNSIWLTKSQKQQPSVTFMFGYYSPRVTTIAITNGAVSTQKKYTQYCRAKTIEISYNDSIVGYAQLADLRATQFFQLGVLGNKIDPSKPKKTTDFWKLTLKIIDTYPGKKKKYVAITDVFFDGLDLIH